MKKVLLASLLCFGAIAPSFANTVYFSDNFSNLNAWTPKAGNSSAYVSNNVLSFHSGNSAGDIFTNATFSSGYINFDYRGIAGSDGGGYVGISNGFPNHHVWLAGTSVSYNTPIHMTNDGQWHHYSIAFNAAAVGGAGHIMLEQFATYNPDHAMFRNLSVSDAPIASVPEPETYGMMLAGLGLLAFMSRRKLAK